MLDGFALVAAGYLVVALWAMRMTWSELRTQGNRSDRVYRVSSLAACLLWPLVFAAMPILARRFSDPRA